MDKILFGLVLILIFLVIIVNINQVETTSAEELKKLPFDRRSLYIKMTELYDKLYKKTIVMPPKKLDKNYETFVKLRYSSYTSRGLLYFNALCGYLLL
ncbi:hypothetical protein [Thermosipho africanus]|uniref:hypothetical protein n=1 Tax=Thermosipho africanus TaxID=2421 RepID=UPI0011D117B7|nr:hypothetical protein [Thermosipho africanus]